ncbi:MAG: DUF4167 domain-containing protein [Xanthobacteraceae bacterium]|uniref:DUF4167 domain-containing protein n=1 Tax=Pseudolabrys sp. TaxID=1960880 RepID=UPI003D0F73AD
MRNGQKRMRGRNHRKSQNPLTRVYESNGPDVKIRGTANHVADKYIQLARDAQSSGDPVAAENYYQHAEHYFRLIAAAQEQFRQQNPYYNQQQQQPSGFPQNDDGFDGDDDEAVAQGNNEPFIPRSDQPQPYLPRDAQFPQQGVQQPQQQGGRQFNQPRNNNNEHQEVGGLPSFITGGQQNGAPAEGQQNGHGGQHQGNQGNQGGDRFGGRNRRRRHRGPRPDNMGDHQQNMAGEGDEAPAGE